MFCLLCRLQPVRVVAAPAVVSVVVCCCCSCCCCCCRCFLCVVVRSSPPCHNVPSRDSSSLIFGWLWLTLGSIEAIVRCSFSFVVAVLLLCTQTIGNEPPNKSSSGPFLSCSYARCAWDSTAARARRARPAARFGARLGRRSCSSSTCSDTTTVCATPRIALATSLLSTSPPT